MPDLPDVFPIGGVLRRYAWGSTSLLQDLLGDAPDGRPAAEVWFGAHPGDPSPALDSTLDRVLDEGGEAPLTFLAKILAADRALSMQVHPTRAQARAGYAREDAAGIALDARERNYVDRNHKPELVCALTPFEALCGFRPVADTLDVLSELAIPELDFVADLLSGPDGLRAAFTAVLTLADPAAVIAAVATAARPDGPLRAVYLAAEHFPHDIGLVLALLLNPVRLEPGQAIYLGAGSVHCYLRGMGVEVMASSDNVLRCGLTPKHLDVAEVLAITDFRELPDPLRHSSGGRFSVPVPDFAVELHDICGVVDLAASGPRIVLATAGETTIGTATLRPGHAAFIRSGAAASLRGSGQVFVASGAHADGVSLAPK